MAESLKQKQINAHQKTFQQLWWGAAATTQHIQRVSINHFIFDNYGQHPSQGNLFQKGHATVVHLSPVSQASKCWPHKTTQCAFKYLNQPEAMKKIHHPSHISLSKHRSTDLKVKFKWQNEAQLIEISLYVHKNQIRETNLISIRLRLQSFPVLCSSYIERYTCIALAVAKAQPCASDVHNARTTILNRSYNMEYKTIKKIKQNMTWIKADILGIDRTPNR